MAGHAANAILYEGHGGDTDTLAGTREDGIAIGTETSSTSEIVGSGTKVKEVDPKD